MSPVSIEVFLFVTKPESGWKACRPIITHTRTCAGTISLYSMLCLVVCVCAILEGQCRALNFKGVETQGWAMVRGTHASGKNEGV